MESRYLSEHEIKELRGEQYNLQIKDFLSPENPFSGKLFSNIVNYLICSSVAKIKSEYVLDLLKNEGFYKSEKTDSYLIELKKAIGIRFLLNKGDLSAKRKLSSLLKKYPLSERTLVRESKYFYLALTNKKIDTAYYPFCYTDRTKIYPEIYDISKVIAVDTAGPGIRGKNILYYKANALKTDFIESNSVQLTVITPGTPVCGRELPLSIDKKFKPELERILDNPGFLVLPKAFIYSLGGDQKDYTIPDEQQEILHYYQSIGQEVLKNGNFSVIMKNQI